MTILEADRVIATDVLVVGGGLAGLNAAIAAREKGAEVLILDKGAIARSGSIGGGIDHFSAYLKSGPEWDTREAWLTQFARIARGAGDLRVHNAIYCRELAATIARMARLGSPLTQPDGTYFRTKSLGRAGSYTINFDGKDLKPRLARQARRLGARALEKFATTSLLTAGRRVVGATAFHLRTGEFVAAMAKAIVLSTGKTVRIFENPMGMPFNAWQCPANTGAAQAMAFRAGAVLVNMEYIRISLVPRGFSAPGLNAFIGAGGQFINGLGEAFMGRYHPAGMQGPRYVLAEGALTELREGRGPIYVDCRHIPEAALHHLKGTLGLDKDTLPDFIRQRGVDLANQPLELMVSEGVLGGPCECVGSGVHIDESCAATVPGLFAAGDCADQASTCAQSTTSGYAAGKAAARYAVAQATPPEADDRQVKDEKARVFAPLKRRKGIPPREIEDILGKVMWQYVGVARNAAGLQTALDKLREVESYAQRLRAENLHYLLRSVEVQDLVQVGQITARAALERKESRFSVYHRRTDFPNTDDENWCGLVLVRKAGDSFDLSFKPLDYTQIPEE